MKYAYWSCGLYWHVGLVDKHNNRVKVIYSYQTQREASMCLTGLNLYGGE